MSDFLSDQDILNLIGDMSNFMGMPGGTAGGAFEAAGTSTSAQHPLNPLTATFVTDGSSGVVSVGFPGDRCVLPTADGHSNLVTDIRTELGLPFEFNISSNSDLVQPRYDLVVGQAMRNGSASGEATLGATFKYAPGIPGKGPPTYDVDYAPVVEIVLPPGGTGLHSSNARVVLPSLSFVSLAGSGSFTSASVSGTAIPMTAAVVTASPFNTPVIVGGAQGLIAPAQDAMPSIQAALNAVGPGGAIYVPSGTYGVKTPATTLNGNLPSPLGQPGGGPGPLSGPLGQTIIFGGAVNFVALADTPALVLTDGCVTIGAPKSWDVTFATSAASGAMQQTIAGLGAYQVNNVAQVQPDWATNGQFATVADSFGTVLAGLITAATSGTAGSVTVDTRGTLLAPATSGTITLGAVRSSYTVGLSSVPSNVFDVGQEIFISGSGQWMIAFLTQPPGSSSIVVESLAQSATTGSIGSGASIYRTYTIPSSIAGTLGGAGSTSPLNIAISNTLSSFAVQLSGQAQRIDALSVDGWANGVLMGPSPQVVPGYGTEGFVGGVVGSIRCDDIRGTAVQLCGKVEGQAAAAH